MGSGGRMLFGAPPILQNALLFTEPGFFRTRSRPSGGSGLAECSECPCRRETGRLVPWRVLTLLFLSAFLLFLGGFHSPTAGAVPCSTYEWSCVHPGCGRRPRREEEAKSRNFPSWYPRMNWDAFIYPSLELIVGEK